MAGQNKKVSVIIPSRRINELNRCLLSLKKQTYPPEDFEIIVVSAEECADENASQIALKNIVNADVNQAEARNIAEKVATGAFLAFCDDDCVLPSNWIETAIKHFSDDKVATVGGPSVPPFTGVSFRELISGTLMISFLGTGSHRKAYIAGAQTAVDVCTPVNFVCANMFVDRAKFNEVGGFALIVPQEEDRLNTKLVQKGYKLIYDPACSNIHYQRPWGFKFIRNIFWLMAGQGSLTKDRSSPSSRLYIIPPLLTIGLITGLIFLSLPILSNIYVILIIVYIAATIAETLRLLVKLNLNKTQRLELFFTFPLALIVHHFTSGLGFIYGFCRRSFRKARSKIKK